MKPTMRFASVRAFAVTTMMLVPVAMLGCGGEPDVSTDAILGNLSPELRGSTESHEIAEKNLAVTNDTNSRLFFDDIGRVLYTDHPSRLSPLPVTGTSGNPR
ncbi:MAG: hypothetical protein ACYTGC_09760 [Planctomycetota bacterium]|jgi:hypothetical protein